MCSWAISWLELIFLILVLYSCGCLPRDVLLWLLDGIGVLKMSEDEEEVRPMRTMSNYEHFCSSQEDIAFTLESKVVEEVMFDPTTTQKMLSLEDFLHSSDFDSDSSGEENGYHHRSQPSNTGIANIMRFSENLHGRYVQRNQQHYQSNQETLEDDVLLCSEAVSAPYMPYHMSHEVDSDDYKYYSSDSSTEDEESDGDYDVHQFGYDGYLDQAIRDDDLVYVSHLLEVLQSTDSSGVSAEHMLTTFCDEIQSVEMLRLFVETGVDVRYYLDTATSIRPDLLIFLVEVVGADFNSCCDGTDPDQDIADDEDTGPISIMLSYYQQPDMLRYLLSNGANIQATHVSLFFSSFHQIVFLTDNGFTVN